MRFGLLYTLQDLSSRRSKEQTCTVRLSIGDAIGKQTGPSVENSSQILTPNGVRSLLGQ
jgi:hypothetical protein